MAIININSLKASGVYRSLIDKSQVVSNASTFIPLVIGFSKVGTFNAPILCPDSDYFIKIFGKVDKTLERRGSYFHRSCLNLLESGPIIALNLLDINTEYPNAINTISLDNPLYDLTQHRSISTSAYTENQDFETRPYSIYYNKQQFWFADTDDFIATAGPNNNLLNIVNLSQRSITVLMRKTNDATFNISAKEWYGNGNVPEYMNENDLISDYFLDVLVIEGDWSNYSQLAVDPIFGKYFHATKGLIKSTLNEFLSLAQINVLNTYTVTLIPDFLDKNGVNYFIESVINRNTLTDGLFVAVDKERFDNEYLSGNGIDLIGHSLESETNFNGLQTVDFLSYNESIVENSIFEETLLNPSFTVNNGDFIDIGSSVSAANEVTISANVINVGVNTPFYTYLDNLTESNFILLLLDSYFTDSTGKYTQIKQVITTNANYVSLVLDATKTVSLLGNLEFYHEPTSLVRLGTGISGDEYYLKTIEGSDLYEQIELGFISQGDKVEYSIGNFGFIKITKIADTDFDTPTVTRNSYHIELYDDNVFTNILNMPAFGLFYDGNGTLVNAGECLFISLAGGINTTIPCTIDPTNANRIIVDVAYKSLIKTGQYLVSELGSETVKSRLTRILKIVTTGNTMEVTTTAPIYKYNISGLNAEVERYIGIEDFIQYYDITSLYGYRIKESQLPSTSIYELNIYDVLKSTNIFNSLLDKNAISFRYIVDTFNKGITENSKAVLTELAYKRENAFAILNAPSMKEFMESVNPIFTNEKTNANPKPNVNFEYVVKGGNLDLNPSRIYSLPTEDDGAAFGAFYFPNIIIRENGRDISVPPASYVAKNFLSKLAQGVPWSVIAGTRRGVISGNGVVGLEYNLTQADREYLEPFGINPIINERNVGLKITANATAKQLIKSSLSSVNATETIIYIQDGIANILKDYVWEINNPQMRLEILTLANQFMEQIKIAGGIFDYQNIMDESNNTLDLIQDEKGILDTFVEVSRGLGIILHRTTLLRTGQISTGLII